MSTTQAKREFTQGVLYRGAQAVYGMLGATVCFLLACTPVAVALIIGGHRLITVAAGVVVGPAWTALVYTMRHFLRSRDIEPFRLYLRGYRLCWRQSLAFWLPYLAMLVVAATDLAHGAGSPWFWPLAVLAAAALLWGSTVLLIISAFDFRLRDVLRLAVYALVRSPRWLLGASALLLVTGGIVVAAGGGVAGLLAAPIALSMVANAEGMLRRLRAEFTTEGDEG